MYVIMYKMHDMFAHGT